MHPPVHLLSLVLLVQIVHLCTLVAPQLRGSKPGELRRDASSHAPILGQRKEESQQYSYGFSLSEQRAQERALGTPPLFNSSHEWVAGNLVSAMTFAGAFFPIACGAVLPNPFPQGAFSIVLKSAYRLCHAWISCAWISCVPRASLACWGV
eukprot:scaffold60725_cov17-Tisochrysis_lutea.AAC.2